MTCTIWKDKEGDIMKILNDKVIKTKKELFDMLECLPDNTLINIGTEDFGYDIDVASYDGISVSLWTKEEDAFKDLEAPDCGDCLCRVCGHNVCGTGSQCAGCNNCTGVIETEYDCVYSEGYVSDEVI